MRSLPGPAAGARRQEDRDVRARLDEPGDAGLVGQLHRDRELAGGIVRACCSRAELAGQDLLADG